MTDSLEVLVLINEDEEEIAAGEGGVARSLIVQLSAISLGDATVKSEAELIILTRGASEDKSTLKNLVIPPRLLSSASSERGAWFQSFVVVDRAPTETLFFQKENFGLHQCAKYGDSICLKNE